MPSSCSFFLTVFSNVVVLDAGRLPKESQNFEALTELTKEVLFALLLSLLFYKKRLSGLLRWRHKVRLRITGCYSQRERNTKAKRLVYFSDAGIRSK